MSDEADVSAESKGAADDQARVEPVAEHAFPDDGEPDARQDEVPRPSTYGLLEGLVGREIATRLRARYSEIRARIHEQDADAPVREAWMQRAEPLNPDLWLTPGAVLDGVRNVDGLFERLRTELLGHSSRE